MCQRITCRKCRKPTFAGCGRHIEAVLGDVPLAERCRCRDDLAAVDREIESAQEQTPRRKWRFW